MKLCIYCKHFRLDMGSPGYSEMTPGSDAVIECDKRVWSMRNGDGEREYRKHISIAPMCPAYEQVSA